MKATSRATMRFGMRVLLVSLVALLCLLVVYDRIALVPRGFHNPFNPHIQTTIRPTNYNPHIRSTLVHKAEVSTIRPTNYKTCKEEKKHFAFLKVPKAGSSTVQNIFYRFGSIRKLTFVLSTYNNYIGRDQAIHDEAIIPPPSNKHYDILCNHVRYKRSEFARILPGDTAYVGIVREPLPHLESFIYYYHFHSIEGQDKLTEYLDNHLKYIKNGIRPNPQTHYYGLQDNETMDMPRVKKFIKRTLSEFDLIIVLERFDESLLVMKRKFCWNLTDILYIKTNTNLGNPRKASSHPQRTKHKSLALSEYLFYENCQVKLIKEILNGGADFQQELNFYRETLRGVHSFCLDKRRPWDDLFYIGVSKWGPETNVSAAACHLMTLPELEFLDVVGRRQYGSQWDKLHFRSSVHKIPETRRNQTLPNGQRVEKRSFNFKDRKPLL